jgi:hypothetical protein
MTLSPNLNMKNLWKTISLQIKQETVEETERGLEISGLVLEYCLVHLISTIVH